MTHANSADLGLPDEARSDTDLLESARRCTRKQILKHALYVGAGVGASGALLGTAVATGLLPGIDATSLQDAATELVDTEKLQSTLALQSRGYVA